MSRSFLPPTEVTKNALRGIDLAKKWGRGDLEKSSSPEDACIVEVAKKLADGERVSTTEVRLLKAHFELQDSIQYSPAITESDGGPTEGTIAWLISGGTAAKKWAEKVAGQVSSVEKFEATNVNFVKVDEDLGLVMGFAIICKQDGKDYFDLQNDHIPEDAMLKASSDFMQGARIVGDMHQEIEGGSVVFAWPMTSDIAEAFGITTKTTGLMIAMKPSTKEMLAKFRDGTYTGFSIGGRRIKDEIVNE